MKKKIRTIFNRVSESSNALLATTHAVQLDRLARDLFDGSATKFDKAMDYVYNTTKQYGADHRLFDGGHSFAGAWKAISKHCPEVSGVEKIKGYLGAIWKDMVTPKGIPVVTWDKQTFDKVAGFLSDNLGVSKAWTKDMVTITGTEFIGSGLGAVSIVMAWKNNERLAESACGLALPAIMGANSLLLGITLIGLSKSILRADNKKQALVKGGKGLVGSGAFIAVGSIGAPILASFLFSIGSLIIARYLYEKVVEENVVPAKINFLKKSSKKIWKSGTV